jgi:hypothetical protein
MAVSLVSGVLAALALPAPGYDVTGARDLFRPEWLVLATLVVWGVHKAARASWIVAVPVLLLASAQPLYVVATAFERFAAAGLPVATGLWIAVVATQVLLFAVAAFVGAAGSLRDRSWERFIRRRLGSDADEVLRRFDFAG